MKLSILITIVGAASLSAAATPHGEIQVNEVCYDNYGCFTTENPWTSLLRPQSALPRPPYEVGTRFLLFTRYESGFDAGGYELLPDKDAILERSNYNATKRTVFLIHGFTDSAASSWVVNARTALLESEDINVIAVDWAPGARSPYLRATANARLVGRQIMRFVDYLSDKTRLTLNQVEFVSHSLGAHVAGYAGTALDGQVSRIIALDPMDPYFAGTDPMVRLDTSDAKFVEVIHTNGDTGLNMGLGMQNSIGHVDIYPNGGKSQPGCKDLLGNLVSSILNFITLDFEGALSTWACSHARAVDYYVETIRSPCPYIAHSCKSYSDYKNGKCYSQCDTAGSCYLLGYGSSKNSADIRGDFYISTDSSSSYCHQVAQSEVRVSENQATTNGKITLQFRSVDGKLSEKFTILDEKFNGGAVISAWEEIPSSFDLYREVRPLVTLRYTRGGLIPTNQPKYLILDGISFTVLDHDLNPKTVIYPAVTLEAGTDLLIP